MTVYSGRMGNTSIGVGVQPNTFIVASSIVQEHGTEMECPEPFFAFFDADVMLLECVAEEEQAIPKMVLAEVLLPVNTVYTHLSPNLSL